MLIVIVAIFGILVLPLMLGELYAAYDLAEQFLPFRAFYANALDEGSLGLWNPWLLRGYSHIGEGQGGLLHPAHMLGYRYLPLGLAIVLEMSLYYPVAIYGMYRFCRHCLGFTPTAALFSGGMFGFCVFTLSHFPHVNMVWVYVHLPYVLGAAHRALHGDRQSRQVTRLAVLYGSMLLLGHPQQVWINSIAVGMWAIVLMVRLDRRRIVKGVAVMAAGIALGSALGAPQLMATAEYLQRSPRGQLDAETRQIYSQRPINLLVNLSPLLFEPMVVGELIGKDKELRLYPSTQELPAYLGLAALTMIFVVLFLYRQLLRERYSRELIVGGIIILIVVLLMLGRYGGVNALIGYLPLASQFKVPARYISILCVATALLAGFALHLLSTRPVPGWIRRNTIAALVLPVAALSVFGWARSAGTIHVAAIPVPLGSMMALLAGVAIAVAAAAACAFVCRRGKGVVVLMVICLVDIAWYGGRLPLTAQRTDTAVFCAKADGIAEHWTKEYRHAANLNLPWWDGHMLATGYLGIPPPEPLRLDPRADPVLTNHHARLVGVSHAHGATQVFELQRPLARVRLVPNLRHSVAPLHELDVELGDTALCRPEVSPELAGPALVEGEFAKLMPAAPEELRVSVRCTSRRLLVVSDRWTKHWEATLDGDPVSLLPLFDGVARGIIVPVGVHFVDMRFRPSALYLGLQIFAVALVLLCCAYGYGIWREIWHGSGKAKGNAG